MHAAMPAPAKPVAQWVFEPQKQAQQPAAPQYQPAPPQYQPAPPQYQPAAPQVAATQRVATPIAQPQMVPTDRLPQDSPLRPAPPPDSQWVYAPAKRGDLPPPQPIPIEEPSVPDIPMRLAQRSAIPGLAPYDEHGIPMPIQPAAQPKKKKKRGKALLVGCLLVLVVLTAGTAFAVAVGGGYITVPGIDKDRIAQLVPAGGIDSMKNLLTDKLQMVAGGEKPGEEAAPPPGEEAAPPPAEEAAPPPTEEAAPPPTEEKPASAEEVPAEEEEEAEPVSSLKHKKHGKKKPKPAAVKPKPAAAQKYPANLGGNLPDKPATEDVKAALKAVEPSVKACGKGMSGPATVSVKVSGSTGKATDVKVVSGPFKGTTQGSCIEKAVKKAKFPRFKQSSISFSYPFAIK